MAAEETDEVPGIVSGAPKRRRIARKKTATPPPDDESDASADAGDDGDDGSDDAAGEQTTMEELELKDLLPQQPMKPVENVKTLGDLIARYNIGQSTEYKLQVWRTYPKIFPGGTKADGFYDTWDQPLTEELIQSEYGGGGFRVVVMGPHPTKPNTLKHYDSISLNLAGTPKADRQPKAVQQSQAAAALEATPPSPFVIAGQENAKLSETAMKMATDMAKQERDERIRVEERADRKATEAMNSQLPMVEAERRRADDLVKAERERNEMERRMLNERLEESRSETKKVLERMEQMEANRPSVASELSEIIKATQSGNKNDDNGAMLKSMMDGVLDKHRIEMEAMRGAHQSLIDSMSKQHEAALSSMRTSHMNEITLMREASAREIAAERESARRREERSEEQRVTEREERRRDQERHRESMESLERSWKDRLEVQIASNNQSWESRMTSSNQSWESRHQALITTLETRNVWLQGEIDRLKGEVSDAKNRLTDNSDPIAIVHKAKEIKDAIGGGDSGGGGGSGSGIGMGGVEDWKNLAVEGLTERAPQILQVLGSMLGGQQQQQQQYTPGQVVQTPQGEMVVVQTPQGLALMPKQAIEQAQAQQQGRMLPRQGNGQRRQRVMPDAEEVANGSAGRKKRRGPVSAVPNFADPSPYGSDPLPVRGRRPPWEGGGADNDDDDAIVTPNPQAIPQLGQPAQQQRQQPAQQQQAPQQRIARQMTSQERQGLNVVAKLVHDAVMNADEPDEFADKILKEWNHDLLRRIVSGYSPEDIARGIAEQNPTSAGATPAGQSFVRDAFAQIEQALQ
jgi:hypothetical protein